MNVPAHLNLSISQFDYKEITEGNASVPPWERGHLAR